MRIDAKNMDYRELNSRVREAVKESPAIRLENVRGQRYIGCGIGSNVNIMINGTPGNDLGAFMNGPRIEVHGNVQDVVGNTMSGGRIAIHGDAGDILGHSMRGGRIYVKGSVGYRAGIHIKSFEDRHPVIVIGGRAGDYLGEYMAGGIVIVLGQNSGGGIPGGKERPITGRYTGTGMHGGALYILGEVPKEKRGPEVSPKEIEDHEKSLLEEILEDYKTVLSLSDLSPREIIPRLTKFTPLTTRPYGNLYAY